MLRFWFITKISPTKKIEEKLFGVVPTSGYFGHISKSSVADPNSGSEMDKKS
jgi:hypothetical protein